MLHVFTDYPIQSLLFTPICNLNNTNRLHNTTKELYQHCCLTVWVNPNILKPTEADDGKLCWLTVHLKTPCETSQKQKNSKVSSSCVFKVVIPASYPTFSRALETQQDLTALALKNSSASVIWSEEHCDQARGENKSWSVCLKVIQPNVRNSEQLLGVHRPHEASVRFYF